MKIRTLVLNLMPLVAVAPAMAADAADNYPSQPITIIAPFPPGGGTDQMTRLVGNHLAEATGWNIVTENKAGAGGTIGLSTAARATPNGYHLVMGQVDNMAVAPALYSNLTYDSVKDFTPIVNVAGTGVVILARADSPYKTLEDVVRVSKEKPNSIDYASPGAGTTLHLSGELLQQKAGIKMQHVPYKGSAPAMADLLSGQVPLLFTSVASAAAQLKAGTVRPLAVTSRERSAILPDVPTVAEALGFNDFDVTVWYGLLAPAGTPDAIVQKLNTQMNQVLKTEAMVKAMNAQGAQPIGGTSTDFARTIERDRAMWAPIVESSGAKGN